MVPRMRSFRVGCGVTSLEINFPQIKPQGQSEGVRPDASPASTQNGNKPDMPADRGLSRACGRPSHHPQSDPAVRDPL